MRSESAIESPAFLVLGRSPAPNIGRETRQGDRTKIRRVDALRCQAPETADFTIIALLASFPKAEPDALRASVNVSPPQPDSPRSLGLVRPTHVVMPSGIGIAHTTMMTER
jgi:hypothetical protein